MWQFFVIVYFGINLAFAMFVLTYDFDECVIGRNVNPLVMFIVNIFVGLFVYIYSMFDSVVCNMQVSKKSSDDEERSIVRVFNDFGNFSF